MEDDFFSGITGIDYGDSFYTPDFSPATVDTSASFGNVDSLIGAGGNGVSNLDIASAFGPDNGGTGSSPSWWDSLSLKGISSGLSQLESLAGTGIGLFKSLNPTAGTFNAKGNFVPIGNSSGVVSTPGQTSVIGPATSGSGIGKTVANIFAPIKPFLPWIVGGVVVLVLLKVFKIIK